MAVTYLPMIGLRYALITVVLARQYSRISGATSLDIDTALCGYIARIISEIMCS